MALLILWWLSTAVGADVGVTWPTSRIAATGTLLAIALEHRLRCPALEGIRKHGRPERCDLNLYDLQIIARRAGLALTPEEESLLS